MHNIYIIHKIYKNKKLVPRFELENRRFTVPRYGNRNRTGSSHGCLAGSKPAIPVPVPVLEPPVPVKIPVR